MNDGSILSEKRLPELPCVNDVLKTWDIWNDKGAVYLYTLPTILEEARVKLITLFSKKFSRMLNISLTLLKPFSQ